MNKKVVNILTASDGSFTWQRPFQGKIHALEFNIGSGGTQLSTPDIDVTDDTYSVSFLSVNGVAANTVYSPSQFLEAADGTTAALVGTAMKGASVAVCVGVLKVAITGAGAAKKGHLNVFWD